MFHGLDTQVVLGELTSVCVCVCVCVCRWSGEFDKGFSSYLKKWAELEARVFGGCCRVTPSDIKQISDIVRSLQIYITSTSSRPLL